jgi:lipopolysaccharide transport system ATP-binding protein
MSDTVISAHHLAKRYRLGAKRHGYRTLRDTLAQRASRIWQAARGKRVEPSENPRDLWALDDVSFQVRRGETLGIVGRNGSGKTTLLKLLSQITEPTRGYADIYGRVGSLLEVGTGFHLELTGRENVYLNGAILGMRKAEIDRRFDEIIAFAEVEKFVDTAVKHYSSGMHMRLAFAVAAHLTAEILLIDEVLAVGDVAFQKKCLGTMEEVARQGRTVLFVSHNMGQVRSLCRSGIVLEQGKIIHSGDVAEALEVYFRTIGALPQAENGRQEDNQPPRSGFGPVVVAGSDGRETVQGDRFEVATTLRVPGTASGFSIHCMLEDMLGRRIFQLRETSTSLRWDAGSGDLAVRVALPPLWLNAGLYSVHFKAKFWCDSGSTVCLSDRFPVDIAGTGSVDHSVLCPQATWFLQAAPEGQ